MAVGKAFALLEARKGTCGIEEYSISQPTLEQVGVTM